MRGCGPSAPTRPAPRPPPPAPRRTREFNGNPVKASQSVVPGDTVRVRQPGYERILEVRRLIAKRVGAGGRLALLYRPHAAAPGGSGLGHPAARPRHRPAHQEGPAGHGETARRTLAGTQPDHRHAMSVTHFTEPAGRYKMGGGDGHAAVPLIRHYLKETRAVTTTSHAASSTQPGYQVVNPATGEVEQTSTSPPMPRSRRHWPLPCGLRRRGRTCRSRTAPRSSRRSPSCSRSARRARRRSPPRRWASR